jgi:hypothetical protein
VIHKLRMSVVIVAAGVVVAPASALAQTQHAKRSEGYVLARAAATYRRVWDIPVYAVEGEVGLGWGTEDVRRAFGVQLLHGRTDAGLVTWGLDFVFQHESGIGDGAWCGFSAELGSLWFNRATGDGSVAAGGIGGALRLGYDFLREGGVRLGPELALDAMEYISNSSVLVWGPTAGVRLRM